MFQPISAYLPTQIKDAGVLAARSALLWLQKIPEEFVSCLQSSLAIVHHVVNYQSGWQTVRAQTATLGAQNCLPSLRTGTWKVLLGRNHGRLCCWDAWDAAGGGLRDAAVWGRQRYRWIWECSPLWAHIHILEIPPEQRQSVPCHLIEAISKLHAANCQYPFNSCLMKIITWQLAFHFAKGMLTGSHLKGHDNSWFLLDGATFLGFWWQEDNLPLPDFELWSFPSPSIWCHPVSWCKEAAASPRSQASVWPQRGTTNLSNTILAVNQPQWVLPT